MICGRGRSKLEPRQEFRQELRKSMLGSSGRDELEQGAL